MKNVLLIGLRADFVDFDKWPQLSKEKLEHAFAQVVFELNQNGFDAKWCLTDTGESAKEQVYEALHAEQPDIILVGAGLRTDPDHFLLFEQVINLIHSESPNAKVAFNSLPYDTLEAVKRWS